MPNVLSHSETNFIILQFVIKYHLISLCQSKFQTYWYNSLKVKYVQRAK